MTINIDNESDIELEIEYAALINKCVKEALIHEKCPYEVEISVVLTDNEGIRSLNREFRNIDKETDVLSFPMIEFNHPSDFEMLLGNTEYFNPDSGELMLGDVMISVEKVISQAAEYGHSIERELAFLIVHSVLHLLSYDHMEDLERIKMEGQQEDILNQAGIFRVNGYMI